MSSGEERAVTDTKATVDGIMSVFRSEALRDRILRQLDPLLRGQPGADVCLAITLVCERVLIRAAKRGEERACLETASRLLLARLP
jgi:hypothetical protein